MLVKRTIMNEKMLWEKKRETIIRRKKREETTHRKKKIFEQTIRSLPKTMEFSDEEIVDRSDSRMTRWFQRWSIYHKRESSWTLHRRIAYGFHVTGVLDTSREISRRRWLARPTPMLTVFAECNSLKTMQRVDNRLCSRSHTHATRVKFAYGRVEYDRSIYMWISEKKKKRKIYHWRW